MPRPIPIAFGDRVLSRWRNDESLGRDHRRSALPVSVVSGRRELPVDGWHDRRSMARPLSCSRRFPTVGDPIIDGGFLCGDSSTYKVIKAVACGAADISQNTSNDNNVPLAVCDAVSVGMRVHSRPGGSWRGARRASSTRRLRGRRRAVHRHLSSLKKRLPAGDKPTGDARPGRATNL